MYLIYILGILGGGALPGWADPIASIAPLDLPRSEGPRIESATPPPSYPNLRIEINIPATTLTLFENHQPIKTYRIAVGSPKFPTPAMHDAITTIIWNPWWNPPDAEWAKDEVDTPPGPKNPLGPVKMLLGDGIRIHGTLSPASIGTAASHGCFRMHNRDAKDLARTIQEKMTDQSAPAVFEKYARFPTRSFYVSLNSPVTVDVIYRPVTIIEDTLVIYPDYYRKITSFQRAVWDNLSMAGINPHLIDMDHLLRLVPSAVHRTTHIPLHDIIRGESSLYIPMSLEP